MFIFDKYFRGNQIFWAYFFPSNLVFLFLQKPIRPSEAITKKIVSDFYDCFEDSRKVPCYLKKIRAGEYFCSRTYKEGICCVDYKSGYVNETTGLYYAEKFASIFPKECKILKLVKYCLHMVLKNKNTMSACDVTFELHKCITKYERCSLNVLPKGM